MENSKFKGIMPEKRLSSLREIIKEKGLVRVMEAHNGLTGRIVEEASVQENGQTRSFDAMWVSSLCDSTAKGKPDIELVDFTSRVNTIEEIMEVTTKPIILDGDTGGKVEHLVYNVRTLERLGVSAIIIEDKVGLKQNSLFGTDVAQQQDTIEGFSHKIASVKAAQMSTDFMCIARIESLILKQGMQDALNRADAYVKAGADGVMIHSKEKEPTEVLDFIKNFKLNYPNIPVVVVPTSYSNITEEDLKLGGVSIIIHANHFIRSAYPAMVKTAESILENHCSAKASSDYCMSIKDILTLIPNKL